MIEGILTGAANIALPNMPLTEHHRNYEILMY